jgi:hypothetical protein
MIGYFGTEDNPIMYKVFNMATKDRTDGVQEVCIFKTVGKIEEG